MTPQEKELIASVFSRLSQMKGDRDAEAQQWINRELASLPNAGYDLVQAVVMLEQAHGQAQQRISALEQQVAQMNRDLQALRAAQTPAGGGSFLGGGQPSRGPVWTSAGSVPSSVPSSVPPVSPGYPQQGYPQQGYPQQGYPQHGHVPHHQGGMFGGGSFLGTAATMAAGVAGGALLAQGISSLFSGGHSAAASAAAGGVPAVTETVNNFFGGTPAGHGGAGGGETGLFGNTGLTNGDLFNNTGFSPADTASDLFGDSDPFGGGGDFDV